MCNFGKKPIKLHKLASKFYIILPTAGVKTLFILKPSHVIKYKMSSLLHKHVWLDGNLAPLDSWYVSSAILNG